MVSCAVASDDSVAGKRQITTVPQLSQRMLSLPVLRQPNRAQTRGDSATGLANQLRRVKDLRVMAGDTQTHLRSKEQTCLARCSKSARFQGRHVTSSDFFTRFPALAATISSTARSRADLALRTKRPSIKLPFPCRTTPRIAFTHVFENGLSNVMADTGATASVEERNASKTALRRASMLLAMRSFWAFHDGLSPAAQTRPPSCYVCVGVKTDGNTQTEQRMPRYEEPWHEMGSLQWQDA